MFTGNSLQIGSLTTGQMASVASNLLNINVSYSMDMANQLSFSVIDPGFIMGSNNYFQIGADVVYETTSIEKIRVASDESPIITKIKHVYEISNVQVSQQNSSSPVWQIEAMPKAVQQMKRDKKPGSISGSGYTFVQRAAKKYGLKFVGEKSSRIKHESKNSGDKQSDSVWTVIKRIADDSQYMVFVQDGVLYFGTQKWLLYRWGTSVIRGTQKKDKKGKPVINKKTGKPEMNPNKYFIPMEYRGYTSNPSAFEVMSLPQISRNENDPMEASGSLQVSRRNGVQIRPGMTIRIKNIPNMSGYYLVTSVTFEEQTTNPVGIEFRTPERLRKEDGEEPEIPMLPVGKVFQSDSFIQRKIFGASAVGEVSKFEIPPLGAATGTTTESFGHKTAVKLPNSRRTNMYPNLERIFSSKESAAKYLPHGMNPTYAAEVLQNMTTIELGNIDIYNRPLYLNTNPDGSKRVFTSIIHIYEQAPDIYALCERVWCSMGTTVLLETFEAAWLYSIDNIHHGVFNSLEGAKIYVSIMSKIDREVLKKRFPKSYKQILAGNITQSLSQIGGCTIG